MRLLPLPAAILHLDGRVALVNDRLAACFGTTWLESAALREVISRSEPVWRALQLRTASGEEVDVLAQSIRCFAHLIAIIDDTSGGESAGDVERLRHALLGRRNPFTLEFGADADTASRFHFDTVIDAELARSALYTQPLSMVLVEGDRIGQAGGEDDGSADDPVREHLERILRAGLRMADLLFRCGDDRFVVLAPATDFRHARTIGTGLRIMVEKHDSASVGRMTVSVGVTEVLDDESRHAWLARAERALLEARESGGNRVIVDARGRSDTWTASGQTRPSRLAWQGTYECGHPVIDAQHRELFALTNQLIEVTAGGGDEPSDSGVTLQRLLEHVARHFSDEEAFLETIEYPFVGAHRLAHRELLDRAEWTLGQAGVPGLGYRAAVDFLITEVVAKHVFDCDRDYFALARLRCQGDPSH